VNHLGHIWVARRTGTSVVGNILGDFVKGDPSRRWDGELLEGIRLHRRIDAHTDDHPAFRRCRERLAPGLRRWAGAVIDVLWDHVLARDWEQFDAEPLRAVADDAYARLEAARPRLPERMVRFVDYAVATDVFVAYGTRPGIERVLAGMSTRVRRPNPLAGAHRELDRQGGELAADCHVFLADLEIELTP
jgi:acyl carrier protein phosphodiesterase